MSPPGSHHGFLARRKRTCQFLSAGGKKETAHFGEKQINPFAMRVSGLRAQQVGQEVQAGSKLWQQQPFPPPGNTPPRGQGEGIF